MTTTSSKTDVDGEQSIVDSTINVAIYVLALYLVVLILYYAYTVSMQIDRYVNLFLGPGLALFLLHQYRTLEGSDETDMQVGEADAPEASFLATAIQKSPLPDTLTVPTRDDVPFYGRGYGRKLFRWYLPVAALLAIASSVYIELNFSRIKVDAPLQGMMLGDVVVGFIFIVLSIHATQLAYGWAIALISLLFVGYGFAGPYLPGILFHTGIDPRQMVWTLAISLGGVFGFITEIGSTWVAIFIIFAGMAQSFGLLEYIMDIGEELSQLLRSGIVQVAVVSSLLIGSITGAAAANTVTTGSFTIPMMQRQGVKGTYAGAIESVASSGAQVMPPVMGTAAFLMANILGISYLDVVAAAFLPAMIFYLLVALGTHLVTLKLGWTVEKTDEDLNWQVFRQGAHYVIPVIVLIYSLVVVGMTPLSAGFYTIVVLLVIHALGKLVMMRPSREAVETIGRDFVVGSRDGALELAPLIGVFGSLGIIVEVVTQTGLSQQLSTEIVGLSGGVFVLLLFFAMVTSILFGLGMPTPAAYILVVFLVAPALIELGVQPLTAHMYVFYFAMLSAITPPVAICVAIASRIADSSFIGTAVQALRLGGPMFLLPYVFVFNDSLIYWSFPTSLVTFVLVLGGFVLLVVSIIGYNGVKEVGWPIRLLYTGLAFVALLAPFQFQIIAFGVGGALLLADVKFANRFPSVSRFSEWGLR